MVWAYDFESEEQMIKRHCLKNEKALSDSQ
jgi:hypothetical protein